MNKTKIEWCDYTWNPISGCWHGCEYCYADRIATRFEGKTFPNGFAPTFYRDRLLEPTKIKKPSKIFVGSMGDLFGDWNWIARGEYAALGSKEVIDCVFETVKKCPQHTFIFLTKNPLGLAHTDFPPNAWAGISHDGYGVRGVPTVCNAKIKFASIEPLLTFPEALPLVDWYIVGAQTGPGAKPVKKEWVERVIEVARDYNKPIFLKDNLNWPEKIQEFPAAVKANV